MNIVLIGFMGTGKSAVGRALSQRLGADFLDTDAEIERSAGKPIRQIFAEDGELAFRAHETALLERLASVPAPPELGAGGRSSPTPHYWGGGATSGGEALGTEGRSFVLATGGGTPLRDENVRLLRHIGPVVWLTAPPATVLRRVGPDLSLRPLLAAFQDDPLARIESLLAARAPRYEALADLTCDTSAFATPEEVAKLLADQLCQPAIKLTRFPTETA